MSIMQPEVGGMRAITISRQYGSGGGEIAARLARRLRWQLIDHEIVAQVASRLGITTHQAHALDEHEEGFARRVLDLLQIVPPATPGTYAGPTPGVAVELGSGGPDRNEYQEALRQVVEAAVDSGNTVIVGRAAQVVLANRPYVLHVRVVAPLQERIAYVALREGFDAADAQARIQLKDRDRTLYLQRRYRRQVDDPLLYDLIINTSMLSLDRAVDLICLALEGKAEALSVPSGELGPARGLAPYAGRPGDVRPPARLIEP